MKFTPNKITHLEDHQIFVFGSNLAGKHNGGGAKIALEEFGAVYGQGIGFQGRSYAIPTLDENFSKLSLEEINLYIKDFIKYSFKNPQYIFLVTKIGCGIAGYSVKEIAPLFGELPLTIMNNVILPEEFIKEIEDNACV